MYGKAKVTLFAPNLLSMVVPGKVLERWYQVSYLVQKVALRIWKLKQTMFKYTSKYMISMYSHVYRPLETNSTSETGKQNIQRP